MTCCRLSWREASRSFCARWKTGCSSARAGRPSDETINLIFRSAHTIKGSAGLFGLDAIVSFVHGVETLLDRVRLGEIALAPQLVQALLDCKDHIAVLVAGAPEAKHGVDAGVAGAERAAAE